MTLARWLLRPNTPSRIMSGYSVFVQLVTFVDVNEPIAHRATMLERQLTRQGHRLSVFTLIAAATALERGFTLVTRDPTYQLVPHLTTEDWTAP